MKYALAWVKILWLCILTDVKSFPAHTNAFWHRTKACYFGFKYRKIYDDRNLFFAIIFLPSLLWYRFKCKRKSQKLGIILEEFYKLESERLQTESQGLRFENASKRAEVMGKFADYVPGATVNDFEAFVRIRSLSLRFLWNSLWG